MPKGINVSYLWVIGFQVMTLEGRSWGLQYVLLAEQWAVVISWRMIGLLPSTVALILRIVNLVYLSCFVVHHWQL